MTDPQQPTANMRRSTSTLMLGTLAGNGVAWLLNFALARIFTNATFGAASVVIAVASVFIGVSTLRLEVLSQRVADEDEAKLLLKAGLSLSLWWGLGLTAAAGVAVGLGASAYWLAVGLMVVMGSLQLVGATTLTRRRAYGRLTVANLQQAAGMSVLQVGFGLLSAGVLSLLAGFAAARLVWLPTLRGIRPTLRPWRTLSAVHRRFGLVAGASALVNALAGQASILLVGIFYTQADTGNYSMGVRVLVVPLAVVSQAVAAAAIGEIGALVRAGVPWYATVRRTVLGLAGIGAVICAAAFLLAEPLAPFLLGEKFDGAGEVIAILAVGSWLQFAVSPFSQLLNITDAHRSLLAWDITRFALLSLAWIVPGSLGAPLTVSLIAYSAAMTVVYLLLFLLIRRAARTPRPSA
ncbi:MAG TPA: oligosaccharide flippase family protein [Arachnia sp.]|jgi:O-antigen/teichoic acid export membrane protein|nr:oligosaccharide flippase family protein [Arachnia sp.]HMR14101.1 oligosaccharide flippase family protein [Arachnia sp.]